MIKIYVSPSCSSCRKVKKWFEEENIPFIEKNIFVNDLSESELKDILAKSENGTEDIISPRSKIVKDKKIDVENMSLNELIRFVRENPSVLKRPIIVDDNKIQVGYNSEDIRVFIPHARRIAEWACQDGICPNYKNCPHIIDQNK